MRARSRAARIACLHAGDFVVEVCRRSNPSLGDRPVAVADGRERREIVAYDRAATGVRAGMTPKQARAACPGLVILARDERQELEATEKLLDALESCGPAVEALRPGVCFFDAACLPKGESSAAGAAIALASSLGFTASGAVADDKFTAYCAALTGGGCSIVPPGGSAAFLAPLPVSVLPLACGDEERFDMLGLRLLGQIAALDTAPLAARFGERARAYARLARGEDDESLQPRRTQTIYEERFAFDSAIDQVEPLFFALRSCIAGVAGRLAGAAQVCDRVEIILMNPATISIPVRLAEPTSSAPVMFDLARIAIESREQLGAVEVLLVRAAPCGESPPQLGLFDGSRGSRSAALAATLARLQATLARDDVVTLVTQRERSRLPERMQRAQPIVSPRQFSPKKIARADSAGRATLWAPALRLLDPPKPMRAPGERCALAGPFRLSESWWDRPVERDYFQLWEQGSLVLAFRDMRDGGWYVQGIFD